MAKYTRTYEKEEIKNELEFMGKKYDFTLKKDGFGMKSDKPCFSAQLKKGGIYIDTLGIDVDMLDCGDDEEVMEILDALGDYEIG